MDKRQQLLKMLSELAENADEIEVCDGSPIGEFLERMGSKRGRVDGLGSLADDSNNKLPLDTMVADYLLTHTFKPGDKVRWKKGLKMANFPEYDQESVVLDYWQSAPILLEPKFAETSSYGRKHNIRLAMKMPDGSLGTFCYDSRHFELIPQGKPN